VCINSSNYANLVVLSTSCSLYWFYNIAREVCGVFPILGVGFGFDFWSRWDAREREEKSALPKATGPTVHLKACWARVWGRNKTSRWRYFHSLNSGTGSHAALRFLIRILSQWIKRAKDDV
jgi:hypothetical protein